MTPNSASSHSDSRGAIWRARLGAVVLRLVDPAILMPETERRRARLLSGLLLSLILLIALALGASSLLTPGESPFQNTALPVAAGATLLLTLAYGLNRRGRYVPAAVLTVLIAAVGAWASIITNRALVAVEPVIVVFVVISVLLASILLPGRATVLLAVAHLLGVYLVFPNLVIGLIFISFIAVLNLVSALITGYDLAQINRQTRELAAREERFRALIENSSDAISLNAPDGTVLYQSPAASKIWGRPVEALVGVQPFERIHPEDREAARATLAAILHDPEKIVPAQYRVQHQDGSWRWIEVTARNLLANPSVGAIVGNYRDITERKRAEEALREADQRAIRDYQRLLDRLTRLAQIVGTARDLTGIYRALLEFAQASAIPCNRLLVAFYNPDRQERTGVYAWSEGREEDVSRLPAMPMNDSPQSRAVATGQIVVTDDFQAAIAGKPVVNLGLDVDPRLPQSSLALPLIVLGRVIGALEVQSVAPAAYTPEHVTALRMGANLAAIATENAGLLERERELRITAQASEEQARRAAARAEALVHVAARLTANLALEALLNAICEEVAHALDVPIVTVSLYDEKGEALYLAADLGLPPEYRAGMAPLPRAVYEDYTQRLGPIVVTPDVQALPDLANADLYARLNLRTTVNARMQRESQLIGRLNVATLGVVRHFTADELALLRGLTDQAALAIANARLYEANLRQLEQLSALYATAQKLTASRDLHELAQEAVRTCVESFGARLAWLGRAEPDGRVRALDAYGQASDWPVRLSLRWDETPEGQGWVGQAIRTGFPVVIADLATDPRFAPWREAGLAQGFCCTLALPLISRAWSFGVLALYSDQPGFFNEERVDFLRTYAHQVAAALENARLFAETRRRLENVQALRAIDTAITGSLDLKLTLNVMLDQVTAQLGVDAASVLLLKPQTQILEHVAGRGFRTAALQHTRLRSGEGHAGRASLERRIVAIADLRQRKTDFMRSPLFAAEDFVAYYGVPLFAKGQVKGVLEIFHRAPLDPDPEWLTFMEALAGQAAIAIDNATLFDDLQRSNVELALAYDTTLEGWSRALDLRDQVTEGHTQRVAEMTLKLARAMGLSEDELVHVRRGALLHDIGKMGIPDSILLKPGKLTDEEWEIMRRHPVYAYELLRPIAYLRPALDIPYCHHEKWDGTGYPRGLKGEQIPLSARLFAVVDVWEALRSDRPYRPGWPEEKVRDHIRSLAGTHFDPQFVEVFLSLRDE